MTATENQKNTSGRVLRPFLWWLLLVLALAGIHWNAVMLERTRLFFSISLNGQPLPYSIAVTLDGKPISSGDKISLGQHQFAINGPQTDSYTTNLSIWYGKHSLGDIPLKRSTGTLSVSTAPPALWVTIQGSEFSTSLSNSSGTNLTVPTDTYTVSVQYPHWNGSQTASVTRDATAPVAFSPRFGALHVTCNRDGAMFQLHDVNGNDLENGSMPETLTELPTGDYELIAVHHNHQLQKAVAVDANVTNEVLMDFEYGGAVFESVPSGASVFGPDDRYWGETPLELSEITPQTLHFQLELNGYQNVPATLDVVADQTNTFSANLISFNYINAIQQARDYLAQSNYDQAMSLVNQAIAAKPDDVTATALQQKIHVLSDIDQADTWASQGNFIKGIELLNDALTVDPDNDQAKTMLAYDTQHKPEQIERERIERLNRPHEVFNEALQSYSDANLFDEHELTTSEPFNEAGQAIVAALQDVSPAFVVTLNATPRPETDEIIAKQNVGGILISGQRICIIVCGQAKDDEAQIWFKVLEYKKHTHFSLQGGLTEYNDEIPVNPGRIQMTDALEAQLTNGVQIVTERIQQVISQ